MLVYSPLHLVLYERVIPCKTGNDFYSIPVSNMKTMQYKSNSHTTVKQCYLSYRKQVKNTRVAQKIGTIFVRLNFTKY